VSALVGMPIEFLKMFCNCNT